MKTALDETAHSLERIQNFDCNSFDRSSDLGSNLNTDEIIPDAKNLVSLFKQLPLTALVEFETAQLDVIKRQADSVFNIFEEVTKFSTDTENPKAVRDQLFTKVRNLRPNVFAQLFSLIAYAAARTVDFSRLETEGRAALQSITDQANTVSSGLENTHAEAERILDSVRDMAAEQGVSQHAIFFKNEATHHNDEADKWKTQVYIWAGCLGLYAILTFFIHKLAFLKPETMFDTTQLVVSKILVFAVIAYLLFLSARNYLSHRHNETVNKHRQNSLLTYKAIADASGTPESRDVILRYAAASIFLPQDTGYVRDNSAVSAGQNSTFIEMTSRLTENT